MKPGIYDIPFEEYLEIDAAHNSGLRQITRSPAHYQESKKNPSEPTPQMRDGSALHTAILEPDKFHERYVVLPDNAPKRPDLRQRNAKKPSEATVQAIQFWDQWELQCRGKEIITLEKWQLYMEAAKAVREHKEVAPMFERGRAEQTIIANDPVTGVLCKVRPDWMTQISDFSVMLEVKSTDDARPQFFSRYAFNLGYFAAAAFYTDVAEWSGIGRPDVYIILAFERSAPWGLKLYTLDQVDMDRARNQYRAALDLYAHCKKTGNWPCYDTDIEPLEYPAWAKE